MIDILSISCEIATRPYWWLVDIGSGSGLVLSGNKAITWSNVDTDLCRHMVSPDHNELM